MPQYVVVDDSLSVKEAATLVMCCIIIGIIIAIVALLMAPLTLLMIAIFAF